MEHFKKFRLKCSIAGILPKKKNYNNNNIVCMKTKKTKETKKNKEKNDHRNLKMEQSHVKLLTSWQQSSFSMPNTNSTDAKPLFYK